MRRLDLKLDVSAAAQLGEDAFMAASVLVPSPERVPAVPVVCFAKPGGGFSRHYYTENLPGWTGARSEGEWHADRGWIFVCLDPLGVGESSTHHDPQRLDYACLTAAHQAAEQEIFRRLVTGQLVDDFPPLREPLRIGLGQSMGGSLTIVQQGRYHWYHGIAVLGFSAVHTHPSAPGAPPVAFPWRGRETTATESVVLNEAVLGKHDSATMREVNRRLFFYDDLDETLVARLLSPPATDQVGFRWQSATIPLGVISRCLTPGIVAPEAAAIRAPVLVALGERDVIADPKGEPRAYLSASSVDLYICPKMGHMHNFATTRELFWRRIHTWGEWVVAAAS